MNNCPKCGNPLQVGTTSCPICGTNILSETEAPKKEAISVTSVGTTSTKPVSQAQPEVKSTPAPVVQPTVQQVVTPQATSSVEPALAQPAPVQAVVEPVVQKVEAAPTSSVEIVATGTNEQPAVQAQQPVVEPKVITQQATPQPVVEPVTQPVQPQSVTPASAQVANQTITSPQVTAEKEQMVKDTSLEAQKIDAVSLAPTIEKVEPVTPIPSIVPTESPTELNQINVTAPQEVAQKPKKKFNKKALIIGGVLLVALVVGTFFMTSGNKNLNNKPNNNTDNSLVATSISSNGYKFYLEDGWIINEDGTNVIVTNSNETVAIKLEHIKTGITAISKEKIEGYYKTRSEFTDTVVAETKINSKEALTVNTNINQAPVQVFFIGGGTELTVGATVVYQSEESKTKYEQNVTKLIETLSYSDESIKAISSMQMYSNIFNAYSGVFSYNPQQPETNMDQTQNEQTEDVVNPNVNENVVSDTNNPQETIN